jgi:hypothetical protein
MTLDEKLLGDPMAHPLAKRLLEVGYRADGAHLVLRGFGPDKNGIIQVYPWGDWLVNGTRIHPPESLGSVIDLHRALGVDYRPKEVKP